MAEKTEIFFITGKGGVGKSLVAAAFAAKQAALGKKTLLVELGDQSFYRDFFSLPAIDYQPRPLRPSLDVALWSAAECLKEYALHLIKVESLYRLFFENAVTHALLNVAPALPELAIVGKVTSGPPRNVGPKMNYDCLVVDAFASGHFTALLRAPKGMSQAIQFGPMGEQSRQIEATLRDPNISHYYVVSLPEELPVIEALELSQQIYEETDLRPVQLLNKVLQIPKEALAESAESDLGVFQEQMKRIEARQQQCRRRLTDSGGPVFSLPLILETEPWRMVEILQQELPDA